jgi:hypothetical protein
MLAMTDLLRLSQVPVGGMKGCRALAVRVADRGADGRCAGGLRGQLVARAASMMTLATTPGSEIMDRCGALTSVTWAPARWAMKRP